MGFVQPGGCWGRGVLLLLVVLLVLEVVEELGFGAGIVVFGLVVKVNWDKG